MKDDKIQNKVDEEQYLSELGRLCIIQVEIINNDAWQSFT